MQVLEREQIMSRFQEVTAEVEQALSSISFEKLDISDEVKEQVRHYPFDIYLMLSMLLRKKVILLLQFFSRLSLYLLSLEEPREGLIRQMLSCMTTYYPCTEKILILQKNQKY